ncbi:MAG: LysR family transcriptional regulator [Gammaproteobacteria bacterium]|nr:LysR family transcriptional regulator [Gammaproteobacteria bacterium]MDH5303823.1 LysR family transcriptional regulator [Gammaproteobacteria bacterium]MDH5322314.1 LysR family transcriptional regulator [Gammaproteobacteria bacterium]
MTNRNTTDIRLQELLVFQAILSNGSITAAAEALGLRQSGVSKQLKILREYFGDELFVRSGRGMAATNKALSVAPQIASLINAFETLHGEIAFDPGEIERDFVISTTDEIQHFLLPELVTRLAAESPRSRIIFKVLDRDYAARQLESGSVDVAITPNWHVPEHLKQKRLFSDDFVVIHRGGHPCGGRKLTLQDYLAASHMMVSPLGHIFGPVDEVLHADGKQRFVSLVVPYFMQVPDALLGSDLLLTLQRRACEELVRNHALAISELPLNARPVHYYLFWHKRYDKDSTNQWLRQVCCDILGI